MKLHLMHDLMELNHAFESVIRGLQRMEKVELFDKEQLRYSCAEVESARVDANREFFDKFDEIVERDAEWAYKFRRAYDQRTKDPFDFYLEIKDREEARRKKGLPPRVVLLPDWDKDDEQRYDEERARKRAASKRRRAPRKPKSISGKVGRQLKTGVAPAPVRKK
ncbi:MAG: hypothetical protein WA581_15115 [Candidatus Acidiferrales bacterium]